MSKYNNVNPGQYKTAGRERPNKVADVRMKRLVSTPRSSTKKPRGRKAAKRR